jgi:hypothetical protein
LIEPPPAHTLLNWTAVHTGGEEIMAKRKKRAKAQPKKRAKLRSGTASGRAQKTAKSARRGGTSRARGEAKSKPVAKNAVRKKQPRLKSPGREIETVVVDVIEEPAPGVVTITEFEETQVPSRGWVEPKRDREA